MTDSHPQVGRRLLLTADVAERIEQAVRSGAYIDDAAQYAGVSERTLYRWLARGREVEALVDAGEDVSPNDVLLLQFWQSTQKARAEAVLRNVTLIQQAAQAGSWQAAAWYLERTAWQKWGRRTMLTGDGGEPIRVDTDHRQTLRQVLGLDDDAAPTDG